ncbi:Protein of unknown function [Bacillus wiedmannii]|uniref:Uncharacterized protein n=1 Tax=Bacillus wiedmannii TaxID=1890302 RepID=A0A1C4G331_9BACI|nr:Protein of unknown function [Bacillus wiedmannii]
MNTYYEEE